MSTRGCVAIAQGDGWLGVYNHSDSYPTWLGKQLWNHLQGKDLKQFADELLSYDDWREYLAGGVCEYCGEKAGQPHSISGVIFMGPPISPEVQRNLDQTGYRDPEAKHHEHGEGAADQMTDQDANALFIEWVYVVAPKSGCITVFANAETAKLQPGQHGTWSEPYTIKGLDDGTVMKHGGQYWIHEPVAQFLVAGPEPDWERVQCGEYLERCHHVEGYHERR
jgi:hypothetical protein